MLPRVLYFWQFAALASPGRFTSVLFRWFGLNDAEIGVAMAAPTFLSLVSLLAGGILADSAKDGKTRTILVSNMLSTCFFQLLALAAFTRGRSRFLFIVLTNTLSRCARVPSGPALDAYTLEYLEKDGAGKVEGAAASKSRYGEERLWGAVSWGIVSVLLGACVEHIGGFPSTFLFNIVTNAALALSIVGCCGLPSSFPAAAPGRGFVGAAQSEEDVDGDAWDAASDGGEEGRLASFQPEEGGGQGGEAEGRQAPAAGAGSGGDGRVTVLEFMRLLLSRVDTVVFLLVIACASVGTALVEGLIFLYFQDMGAGATLLGVTVAVTGEPPRPRSPLPPPSARHARVA
jgi:hypothetical protein